MIPKILAPGITCTKFKLNLAAADRTERMFKVAIALILPTAIFSRGIDLTTTYVGLIMGKTEANLISAPVLGQFGFIGLILLNVGVIVFQLLTAWFAYGTALRHKDSTRIRDKGGRLLLEFLIIIALFLPLLVETYTIASNFQVIFG